MNMQIEQLAPTVREQESCARCIAPAQPHCESSDSYVGVILHLNDRTRVVICKDALQWIIQGKRGVGRRRADWRGKGYFITRDALIKACDALNEPLSHEIAQHLGTLPRLMGAKA